MDSRDEFFFHHFFCSLDDSSSDDEDLVVAALVVHDHIQRQLPRYRGSVPDRAPNLNRNRERGHALLYADYFVNTPLFKSDKFRRRFRMARHVFNRIREGVVAHDPYFECKTDALGKLGFSSYQKCTAGIRMLAYGIPGDLVDEYVRMSETTCLMSMYKFCQAVIKVFGPEYLRQPTAADTERLLATNTARGFPGMLGSIDCMHWEWKNCQFAWQGKYKGHVNGCTVILEAMASQDLWIWHSFFGMAGSHNDINVLQHSPVFARLAEGHSPPVNFEINGHQYNKGYYLAEGMYPQWSTFVKTISKPQGEKRKRFAQMQESVRKDVERAFGVLQSRWGIVQNSALSRDVRKLWEMMTACVIMHKMIVEDERDESIFDQGFDYQGENIKPLHQDPATFEQFAQFHREMRDWHTHLNLQNDLVEHLWDHIVNQ
ncbi:uncharacterized protein [Aegilops tauschii subsp. strangulata]|uniref:uncharacterized protein n=1 Tax=Aegilops tauschii subsp. strangulata TaxID=200361 RepID=UPI00098B497B|nr:uncharacterized protein LOC109746446 [Aegilops tauschii subsp. strangulata]